MRLDGKHAGEPASQRPKERQDKSAESDCSRSDGNKNEIKDGEERERGGRGERAKYLLLHI